jgi:hypothetical protein
MADNTYQFRRDTPRDRRLRASDEDRNAVADILRREHAAGRIDTEEFAERFGRCLEAKTYAELDDLVADLPLKEQQEGAGAPAGESRAPRWARPRPWRVPAVAWAAALLAVVALAGGSLFWLAFPLLFFFVLRPLFWQRGWRRGVGGYGRWDCRPEM